MVGGGWCGELRLQQVGKGRYFASSGKMYKGGSTQAGCIGSDDGGVEKRRGFFYYKAGEPVHVRVSCKLYREKENASLGILRVGRYEYM